jgi:hypothetical protein
MIKKGEANWPVREEKRDVVLQREREREREDNVLREREMGRADAK